LVSLSITMEQTKGLYLLFLLFINRRCHIVAEEIGIIGSSFNLPPGFAVFASGEVACVRLAITNKFASHSLTRNFILLRRGRVFSPYLKLSGRSFS
jgi:hypothetical protein